MNKGTCSSRRVFDRIRFLSKLHEKLDSIQLFLSFRKNFVFENGQMKN